MNQNEKDIRIINQILVQLSETYIEHKYFTDGVDSKVILLNNKYLIKQNNINSIKAEIEFLENTFSTFFQEIVYYPTNLEYIVYTFIYISNWHPYILCHIK